MLSSIKVTNYLTGKENKIFCRTGSSDLKAVGDVFKTKCYNDPRIFKTDLYKGSWIDLGGNIGSFAVLVGDMCQKVKIYDPVPENCDLIKKNLDENKITNYEIICAAAVKKGLPDKLSFYVRNDDQNWRSSLFSPKVKGKVKQKITVKAEYPDPTGFNLLKLDIEGGEYDLIDSGYVNNFGAFVMEYGFEIDKSITNYKKRMKSLPEFEIIGGKQPMECLEQVWPKSWFPRAVMLKGVKNGQTSNSNRL